YRDYIRAGGGMESLFQRTSPELDKLVEDSGGLLVRNPSDITRLTKDALSLQWLRPARGLRRAGEGIEQGPPPAAFRRHLAAGESPTQAAMAGRRATVDFARGGEAIKQANAVVQFLNARVQGGLNVARTLRDDKWQVMGVGQQGEANGSRARLAALATMAA